MADGLLIDLEQAASYVVQIRVSDGQGGVWTENVTISLTDVSPEVVTGDARANTLRGGVGTDTLVGGGDNDRLDGGAGADKLQGGAGVDNVSGGLGNDTFVFAAPGEAGDSVTDLRNVSGDNDLFHISAAAFGSGLVGGRQLAASQFQIANDTVLQGSAEANIRFIFEADVAKLWFDSNGSAAGGLRLVADLQAGVTMAGADIWLM